MHDDQLPPQYDSPNPHKKVFEGYLISERREKSDLHQLIYVIEKFADDQLSRHQRSDIRVTQLRQVEAVQPPSNLMKRKFRS
jgi:hypothetical protein